MTDDEPITVLICDDHPIVRSGLAALLESTEDIVVVAEASDGEEAISLTAEHHPDIILMDVSMPGMDGLEATRRLLAVRPESRVVMLTSYAGHERIRDALHEGAVGYILKDAAPEDVIRHIRTAARTARNVNPPPPA